MEESCCEEEKRLQVQADARNFKRKRREEKDEKAEDDGYGAEEGKRDEDGQVGEHVDGEEDHDEDGDR